jgi:hypothetical protein
LEQAFYLLVQRFVPDLPEYRDQVGDMVVGQVPLIPDKLGERVAGHPGQLFDLVDGAHLQPGLVVKELPDVLRFCQGFFHLSKIRIK